jgi:hypothetical protein
LLNRQTAMPNLVRHAFAAIACLLFVFLWLTAGNQDAVGSWIDALTRPAAACTANPPACAGQTPGRAGVAIGTAVVESSILGSSEPVAGGWRMQRPRSGS